jgi:hypothetical protein
MSSIPTPLQVKPASDTARRQVVYLDQNVVSDMAKLQGAHNIDAARATVLTDLYQALREAVWNRRSVICPESLWGVALKLTLVSCRQDVLFEAACDKIPSTPPPVALLKASDRQDPLLAIAPTHA